MSENQDQQLDLFEKEELLEKESNIEESNENLEDKNENFEDKSEEKIMDENEKDIEDQAEEEEFITAPSGEKFTLEEWTSPIVEGGPTRQEVEEWKEKHGNVYFTPFENDIYIWRTLTRPEYREIIRNTDLTMLDREEIITEKCVLFPRNFSIKNMTKGKAGIPSLLSEMIMDKSGFVAQSAPIKL